MKFKSHNQNSEKKKSYLSLHGALNLMFFFLHFPLGLSRGTWRK